MKYSDFLIEIKTVDNYTGSSYTGDSLQIATKDILWRFLPERFGGGPQCIILGTNLREFKVKYDDYKRLFKVER